MAQVDYFLKIDGVEGDSAAMKGHIDVSSFSWGATNMGTQGLGGGGGGGKSQIHDAQFTMMVNKASVKIAEYCAKGTHVEKAVLVCRKAGDKPMDYLKYIFEDTFVSSYQSSGSAGSIIPTDSFSLNFGKMEVAYQEQDSKGGGKGWISMKYNVKENK